MMDDEPRVPIELQHMVIDNLYRNHVALGTCTLVCKSWLSRAQPLLYHRVALGKSSTRDNSFCNHIATYPHLCRYVRCLRVEGQISLVRLARILQNLRLLEDLSLINLIAHINASEEQQSSLVEELLAAIFSLEMLRTIRLYVLFWGLSHSPSFSSNLLLSVTGLRQLHSLEFCVWEQSTPYTINTALRQAIVQVQQSASGRLCTFGTVLRDDDETEQAHYYQQTLEHSNLLLEGLGPGIEHLKVTIYIARRFLDAMPRLQLSSCRNLRRLELFISLFDLPMTAGGEDDCRQLMFSSALAILESLPAAVPVEEVILVLDNAGPPPGTLGPIGSAVHREALAALEERLCSLPQLRSIILAPPENLGCTDARLTHVWVSQNLPRLTRQKGIQIICEAVRETDDDAEEAEV